MSHKLEFYVSRNRKVRQIRREFLMQGEGEGAHPIFVRVFGRRNLCKAWQFLSCPCATLTYSWTFPNSWAMQKLTHMKSIGVESSNVLVNLIPLFKFKLAATFFSPSDLHPVVLILPLFSIFICYKQHSLSPHLWLLLVIPPELSIGPYFFRNIGRLLKVILAHRQHILYCNSATPTKRNELKQNVPKVPDVTDAHLCANASI